MKVTLILIGLLALVTSQHLYVCLPIPILTWCVSVKTINEAVYETWYGRKVMEPWREFKKKVYDYFHPDDPDGR